MTRIPFQIEVVATTVFHPSAAQSYGYKSHPAHIPVQDADELAEFAGRACYESWMRPNPKTATIEGYIANILSQNHHSVLEHASVTFAIRGISRALTHELVRHRHLSYSQRSQRYVNEGKAGFVIPPVLDEVEAVLLAEHHYRSLDTYNLLVDRLVARGVSRKAARGAARSALSNATDTGIVVTGNHRAWREVIAKRDHPAADQEIQEFAHELLVHLKRIAPAIYQDMPLERPAE